jgi:heterodisulfide reductase subunit B
MYFTQLIGIALGIDPEKLGIGKELISSAELEKFST